MDVSAFAIFGAGLLTFASPCVLPLIPIYLATIAGGSAAASTRHTLARAAAFSAGLSGVFVMLGALASTLGRLLLQYKVGLTLTSGALMLLFGLRSLGLLRLRALDRDVRPAFHHIQAVSTLFGAFVFGAAFALGWSPCIGPVLASVLTYAAAHADSPLQGAGHLSVYAAGLSVPLLAIAAAAARGREWLKRSQHAIPRLEKLTGGALAALGAWSLLATLWPAQSVPFAALETTRAPAVEVPSCDTNTDPSHVCALPSLAANARDDAAKPAVVGSHMLEFTSRDCPVCRRMQPVLERLSAGCHELNQRIVKVDVTTPNGRALADRHGVRGTPTFVLFNEAGVEVTRLLGERSKEDVAAAVEQAFGLSCWG